jgi:hypothetical protein
MSTNLGQMKEEPTSPPASPPRSPPVSPPRGDYKVEMVDDETPMVECHPDGEPVMQDEWSAMITRACNVRVMIRKHGTLNHLNIFLVGISY